MNVIHYKNGTESNELNIGTAFGRPDAVYITVHSSVKNSGLSVHMNKADLIRLIQHLPKVLDQMEGGLPDGQFNITG